MREIQKYIHKVQYYETDQMRVVHHSNYIRWFEEARVDLMEQMGMGYDRMEELGLVDDEDYARRLAQELARKGYAAPRTAQELARRGIDRDLARAAAQEAVSDPGESLRALIARKYARRLGDEKGRRQTVAALQRLGYRWDEIRSALREFDALPEGDTD